MSDSSDGGKQRSAAPILLGGVVLLFVLYVLSPLPVIWAFRGVHVEEHGLMERTVNGYFKPLAWAADNVPPVQRFYDWYLSPL